MAYFKIMYTYISYIYIAMYNVIKGCSNVPITYNGRDTIAKLASTDIKQTRDLTILTLTTLILQQDNGNIKCCTYPHHSWSCGHS